MLQPNPRGPRELPPTAAALEKSVQEAIDARYEKEIHRRRRLIAVGKVAVMSLLFVNANVSAYLSDVRNNMIATAEAEPSVLHIGDPLNEPDKKANIYFDGFNTFGASNLIKSLGEGYQQAYDGENWSIQYNNAPLNSAELSELTLARLTDEDVQSVDYVSYSMGDDPMLDVAVDTIANTDTRVENITIIAGPADFDTLTENTKEELALAKNLAWIPWIEYSTSFRYILETYFYRDNIQRNAWAAFGGINTRFSNGDVTTNSFLASQIESVSKLNIPQKLEEIGKLSETKHMPNINVITINDNRDTVVDNDRSAEKICGAAFKAGLHCTIRGVDSVHSGYYFPKSVEQYTAAFDSLASLSKTYTADEIARIALIRQGQYQHWLHTLGASESDQSSDEE